MPDNDDALWQDVAATCDRMQPRRMKVPYAPVRTNLYEEDGISALAALDTLRNTPAYDEHIRQRMAAGRYGASLPVYGMKAATGQAELRRLRKGKNTPDATLDLHGMTTDGALDALRTCLPAKAAQGARLLLIITGKGQGVLKNALPQMLCREDIAPFVVCYEQASPAHGGGGAFYAVLRKALTQRL